MKPSGWNFVIELEQVKLINISEIHKFLVNALYNYIKHMASAAHYMHNNLYTI